MENILIVIAILIIGSALGGTQLPKLPGAILSLGALVLAFFNSHARENMESILYSVPILLTIVGMPISRHYILINQTRTMNF